MIVPFIQQSHPMECGLACIQMICRAYGLNVSLTHLRTISNQGNIGLSVKQLANLGRRLDFETSVLDATDRKVDSFLMPFIAYWNGNHYVVVTQISSDHVTVLDPAIGRREISICDFERSFSKIVIEYSPLFKTQKFQLQPSNFFDSFGTLRLGKNVFAQTFFLSIVVALAGLAVPLITQWALDVAFSSGQADIAFVAMGLMLLFGIIKNASTWLRNSIVANITTTSTYLANKEATEKLFEFPISYFSSKTDLEILENFDLIPTAHRNSANALVEGIGDLVATLISGIAMFFYAPSLAFLTLLFVATIVLVKVRATTLRTKSNTLHHSGVHYMKRHLSAAIVAAPTVKWFGRKARWINGCVDSFQMISRSRLNLTRISLNENFAVQTLNVLLSASSLGVAVYLLGIGGFSIGAFMAFIILREQFSSHAQGLLGHVMVFKELRKQLVRIDEGARTAVEHDSYDFGSSDLNAMEVKVNSLLVRQHNGVPCALKNIDCVVSSGDVAVLTGLSTIDREALLHVIGGFSAPTFGMVYYNGCELSKYGKSALYKNCSFVSKTEQIFEGTILENITFFDDEPDMSRFRHILQICMLEEEIAKLPLNWNAPLAFKSKPITDCFTSRLILARGLYKQPQLVLIDNVTNQMSPTLEKQILANLCSFESTFILHSDRLSTGHNALGSVRTIDLSEQRIPVLSSDISNII